MELFTKIKMIIRSLPALGLFLLGSAAIIEGFSLYGLIRSAAAGASGELAIYLLIVVVLGILIAVGVIVGWHLSKPK